MSMLEKIATKIIKEQELIIGPIAWSEARKVIGVTVLDEKLGTINLSEDNEKNIVDNLVKQYEHLFGRASKEASKDAVASLLAELSKEEIPQSLI